MHAPFFLVVELGESFTRGYPAGSSEHRGYSAMLQPLYQGELNSVLLSVTLRGEVQAVKPI